MAKGKNQWVVPTDDGWGVRSENSDRLTRRTNTKDEAIEIAKEIAKNQQSELIIQKKDGTIQARNSYGQDPYPPEG